MEIKKFTKLPILGILRHIELSDIEPLCNSIINSGLETIEVALNTKNAFSIIKKFIETTKGKLTIGAGTVLNTNDLKKAFDSGATFIVSPVLIDEVAEYCRNNKIPFFPGALTPKEIYNAWQQGATMVKVFPASVFGPKYFQEIRGPFDSIKLMAVGGVTNGNVREYFINGASAIAFGGSILKKERLVKNEFNMIEQDIQKLVETVKSAVKDN